MASMVLLIALAVAASQQGMMPDNRNAECFNCNVILVSVEPLQKQHTSVYGYERNTTPNIAELAESSTVFRNAYSTSGHTLPATASTFTSLHPSQHGVSTVTPVPERSEGDYSTLAEILRNHGYNTHAIDNRFESRETAGLEEGFDTYTHSGTKTIPLDIPRYVNNEPFFLYIQSFSTHSPYTMNSVSKYTYREAAWTEPYRSTILERRAKWVNMNDQENVTDQDVRTIMSNEYKPRFLENDTFRRIETAAYDASILSTDKVIGRIIDDLDRRDLRDDTVIVFMSQHGELLGEHRVVGHPTLYEEVMSVPLIINIPGEQTESTDSYVSSIDVAPTVLELVGVSGGMGESAKGISLLPLLKNGSVEKDFLFAEHNVNGSSFAFIDPQTGLKYFVDERYGVNAVYNLSKDDPEAEPVQDPDLKSYMKNQMEKYGDEIGFNFSEDKKIWPYFG